jgi:hypothetical protein
MLKKIKESHEKTGAKFGLIHMLMTGYESENVYCPPLVQTTY